eukprot:g2025.t1
MDERCPLCRVEIQQLRNLHTSAIANDNNVPDHPPNQYQVDQLTMDLIDALESSDMCVESNNAASDDNPQRVEADNATTINNPASIPEPVPDLPVHCNTTDTSQPPSNPGAHS